ncbi:MAG TPA: dethiobiotin synthase, partial [Nitrososphaera sp.]|nr:dethiobiotin synthase [Nitrososphaera sp.]
MRGVFVTGTDTGIGKTVFSAGLAWVLRKRKIDVGVMKPFATGASAFSKKYRSEDVAMLAKAAGVKEIDSELNPSYYDVPASPLMASVLTGESPPVMQNIIKSLKGLSLRHDFLIVEGIGGIQVPLAKGVSVVDFVELTGLPVIIVSRAAVGTLNHTILTVNE